MKRLFFSITIGLFFLSCAAQNHKAKTFKFGIKLLGTHQINSVDANSMVLVTDTDGYVVGITASDLAAQIGGGGGGGPIDAAITKNSPNAVQNGAIYDRFLTTVSEAGDSPQKGLTFWVGDSVAYGNRTPLDSVVYWVTDMDPPGSGGGGGGGLGDMLKSVYDTDDNGKVDDADKLGGVAASGYLTSEVDGSITNELQTLSITGRAVTLSDGGGTINVPSELQTISINGRDISLSDGGGTVSVPESVSTATNTFTPVLDDGGSNTSYTYTLDYAEYYKVGKQVTVVMKFTNINGTGSGGGLQITGMPFTTKRAGSYTNPINAMILNCTNYDNDKLVFYANGTLVQAAAAADLSVPVNVAFSNGSLFINATYYAQ